MIADPIVSLLIYLAILGLIAWVLIAFVPMDARIRQLISAVAVILGVLLVVRALLAFA